MIQLYALVVNNSNLLYALVVFSSYMYWLYVPVVYTSY